MNIVFLHFKIEKDNLKKSILFISTMIELIEIEIFYEQDDSFPHDTIPLFLFLDQYVIIKNEKNFI